MSDDLITPAEFAKRMQWIRDRIGEKRETYGSYDQEDTHRMADVLMEEVLIAIGYGDGVAIFEDMPKWYA